MKQSITATGGAVNNAEVLTSHEEQVLDIMCATSVNGHPDVFESNNDEMEVEYLYEYEKEARSKIVHCTDSINNTNILSVQNRKTILDKEFKNSVQFSNEKENIDTQSVLYSVYGPAEEHHTCL
ncbi:uncharacterized protein LOC116853417 [Odontomachus brunneus]|uniref:uncharacterized protein LOC116853417 n=1 Tax=Odontomachus brunneus TaxID=486640 RepID=UPI0013F2326A|nr:uncharacterized protein LOC116853417 [Odontomachus brunneus]